MPRYDALPPNLTKEFQRSRGLMSRRSSPCTQADLTRALKAAKAAGVSVAGVRVDRDGATVFFGEPNPLQAGPVVELDKTDDTWSDVDGA